MNDIAQFILMLTFIAVGVCLILFLVKLLRVADQVEQTVQSLKSDVTVTLYQTNELLAKTNVLVEDVNGKIETLDPLFTAVADLSETVSDLNQSARNLAVKAKTAGTNTVKAGGLLTGLTFFSNLLKKKGEPNG